MKQPTKSINFPILIISSGIYKCFILNGYSLYFTFNMIKFEICQIMLCTLFLICKHIK